MTEKNFKIRTQQYFKSFASKDLKSLSNLYSKEIILIDWDVNVIGIDNVLNVNSLLFKEDFELQVLDIIQYKNQTINTIIIKIPIKNIEIEVIDILTFNNKTFQIEKIRAYKG